ncbi:MAG: ATP-dependent DNA helicase RecQ [Bacteroidales bacterium]
MEKLEILKKYWGYNSFRALQEEIIDSVLAKKNTIALLPTGGGKSLCFQVPAMAMEGICIVVSPLIALMKDQVANLKKIGIAAATIYSGMSAREMDIVYSNCLYGETKFLYVSPERLKTDSFLQNLQIMKVCLLAIDEAHCISQWGYDFRPSYLEIPNIKPFLEKVPVIALTATATEKVIQDITDKLQIKGASVFTKSFRRDNLNFIILDEAVKAPRLLKLCQNIKGNGIIYTRNRKKTVQISFWLQRMGIQSVAYHAGMDRAEREKSQNDWISGKSRIIVATNAFGMGIDKADVRFVVHVDIPDSIEAYYQEAGRAGRDGKESWCVLMYSDDDIYKAKNMLEDSFPSIRRIKEVYEMLGNFFQLPIGSGKDQVFSFSIHDFCRQYDINATDVFHSLKFLEKEEYIVFQEKEDDYSKVQILFNKQDLYRFQIRNKGLDHLIKILLRNYMGIFTEYSKIEEKQIAIRLNQKESEVVQNLKLLQKHGVIDYFPALSTPKIVYLNPRLHRRSVNIDPKNYTTLKEKRKEKLEYIERFIEDKVHCRSRIILSYFGESDSDRCGKCDRCREIKNRGINQEEFEKISESILSFLSQKELTAAEISDNFDFTQEKLIHQILTYLLEQKVLQENNYGKLAVVERDDYKSE